jgi:hypothetical protein
MIRIALIAAALFASASAFACPDCNGKGKDAKEKCADCPEHKGNPEHKDGEKGCANKGKDGEKGCAQKAKAEGNCKDNKGKACPFAEKDVKKAQ